MMRQLSKFAAVCTCGLTMLAAGASAQMGMRPSMPSGIFTPTVGAGAAYEVTSSDGKTQPIEFALVGKESVNGKDGYWMEWTTSTGRTGQMIMKTLIVPGATDAPTRMIMQMASGQPMEMPTQGRMGAQAKPNTDIREGGQDLGKESVTVPAGTFNCEHYRSKDGGDHRRQGQNHRHTRALQSADDDAGRAEPVVRAWQFEQSDAIRGRVG